MDNRLDVYWLGFITILERMKYIFLQRKPCQPSHQFVELYQHSIVGFHRPRVYYSVGISSSNSPAPKYSLITLPTTQKINRNT